MTGMSGDNRDQSTSSLIELQSKTINEDGSITISYLPKNSDGSNGAIFTNTYYSYYTEKGIHASTTGTIYGVYDMSGGELEYTANYLKDVQKTSDGYTYDYVYNFNELTNKYVTGYLGTGNADKQTENYTLNKSMYGDAVWETSNSASGRYSWNNDHSYFPYLVYPFFIRGGDFRNGINEGVFHFNYDGGGRNGYIGFRVVAL